MPVLLILAVLLTGCTSLLIRDTDSTLITTGKVSARVLLAVPTLFLSEVHLRSERDRLLYARWYRGLSPEERALEDQRQPQVFLFMRPPTFAPHQVR